MKSPFPGMDPYLESQWGDVHTSLITYARDQLQAQLPGDLKIRVEEHVTVQSPDEEEQPHGYYPDVTVIERPHRPTASGAQSSDVAVAEPILVSMNIEPATERSIQIIDTRSGNRIVTTIEFLSPVNKCDEHGRNAYRRKQKDYFDAGVNLVEIDLLREGKYVLAAPLQSLPRSCAWPYRVIVSRASRPEFAEAYRVSLRERLPIIRIPLRPTDADVRLDLQLLIDAAYENGGYDDTDYRGDPIPPLGDEDAVWAKELLSGQGRR